MNKKQNHPLILLALFFIFALSLPAAAAHVIMDGTFTLRARSELLDAQLRARMTSDPAFAASRRLLSRPAGELIPGQTQVWFQAYNFTTGQYEARPSTFQREGKYCRVYLDDASKALLGTESAQIFDQVYQTFDTRIQPLMSDWFGTVTIPARFGLSDDKIDILLLDIRDNLGDGYVAGFFDPRDLEGDLGNRRPVMYMDLNPGRPGNPADRQNDFYRTLAHEYQHMINYSRHLPENRRIKEDRWIEEGLSGFAEYLYSGAPPSPHLARFLENPNLPLTSNAESEWFQSQTLFRHYGASFLFIYYIQEKFGGPDEINRKAFVRSVVDNPSTGINGLNAIFATCGTDFPTVIKSWILANHLNEPTLGNGMWGYIDKDKRLGSDARGLPLPGTQHSHSPSGLPFLGGDGQVFANAGGQYEMIGGTGNLDLQFKSQSPALTPFIALVDFDGTSHMQNLLLDDKLNASFSLDLNQYSRVILVPTVATTQVDVREAFYYSFSGSGAKTVVYPIPNPAFTNEFMIVFKSLSGGFAATPSVTVTFNNLQSAPAMTPVDESRTLFVADYTVPGPGQGRASVLHTGGTSTFSFYSTSLRAGASSRIDLNEAELTISSRREGDSAAVFESPATEMPSELTPLSKPYYIQFDGKTAIEARLLIESAISDSVKPSQIGIWCGKKRDDQWGRVSRNERGWFRSIADEGVYVLAADVAGPKIHDLRIEEPEDHPTLLARLEDGGSGVAQDSIRVEVNGRSVPFSFDPVSGRLESELERLPKGMHQFSVELKDRADNIGKATLTQTLAGPLIIVQSAVWPNPARGPIHLAVILDGSGSDDPTLEIDARIFDVSGACIMTIPLSYTSNHTYSAHWDGRNEFGGIIANGVYPFKVVVRRGGEELKTFGKLAVLH
ncbi:MAG: hypothetical protein HQM09_01175 [Candidatus Riflebacteria bacterium]|nr:hypothetical protein [Candidatus Riflebacteria bacterium]